MKKKKIVVTSLRQGLSYQPVELAFGTSGLRGLVRDITHIEAYVNARGFLAWLLERGQTAPGGTVFVAGDLRPSTTGLMAEEGYRGDILQAVLRAIADAGLVAGYCGAVPTPALVLHAMGHAAPGIMITGSHIPLDRNGIKFTRPAGEVTKGDEAPILAAVHAVRQKEYTRPAGESIFDEQGMLRLERRIATPPVIAEAREGYVRRFTAAFPPGALAGRKLLAWQHSAVGRDICVEILAALGAEVVPAGRSDSFVAVDTEALSPGMLAAVQALVDAHPSVEAVVSTDGDSDRPLVLAVENGRLRFIPGDLLGLLAAGFLGARHAAVPVSANDAVDAYCSASGIKLEKTRIGSPHVIAAMREVGWESNGGFLTAVPVTIPGGGTLSALPTRDALLPILCVLCASRGSGASLSALLDTLPKRYGRSAVVRDIDPVATREIIRFLSPTDPGITGVRRTPDGIRIRDAQGAERTITPGDGTEEALGGLRERVDRFFTDENGFDDVSWVDWRDGVRIGFSNGDVAHVRPSGNAPEMRIYANAGSMERAEAIASLCAADNGILRRMEHDARERMALAGYKALPRPILITGALQDYAWGGRAFIPGLLGLDNGGGLPFAELWMGAHPRAPAVAEIDGAHIALDRLVAFDPWLTLGSDVALRFAGRLPYLFKVLDARDMLSIQAHPSKAQAEEGFARENEAGIPIDAGNRNYRDDNHKPEVHAVLTDFWMLHGFRPLEEIGAVLSSVPEMAGLMPGFDERLAAADPASRSAILRGVYAHIMTMPQQAVDGILNPLVARLEAEEAQGSLRREDPGFWALRAARTFPLAGGHRDRGIISIYILNLVHLKPGQGTFQPAGTLHAYLEGVDVELMANSDNVLRGGLTPKHVDVPELLSTLSFRDGRPAILEGRATSEASREYETPAEEFCLERIEVAPGVPYSGGREHSADCLIVIEGAAAMVAAGRTLTLSRGGIVMVPAAVPYSLAARAQKALLFKAGVPLLGRD